MFNLPWKVERCPFMSETAHHFSCLWPLQEAVLPQAAVEVKAGMVDMVAPTETPTVDSDEDDDDDDETEEDVSITCIYF